MKKHLIAAAVAAAVAVPAMAQVTISGTLDVRAINSAETVSTAANANVSTTQKQAGNVSGITNSNVSDGAGQDGWSTSELIFDMSEDLGGGLKAAARYSNRISSDQLGTARDRYIDLSGGFGGIRIGRFNSAITASYLGLSGLGTTGNAGSFYGFVTAGLSSSAFGTFEREANMIQYTSPNFIGLVATLGYKNGKLDVPATTGADQVKQQQATLTYTAGPLVLAGGMGQRDVTLETAQGNTNTVDLYWLAGAYDLGAARVHVTHGNREAKTTAATTNDTDLTTLAVSVPLGAITLRGSYYSGADSRTIAANTGVDLKGYQLSGTYSLSKRTLVYLVTGQDKTTREGGSTEAVGQATQTGFGISHRF